jgi:hypothetical protein
MSKKTQERDQPLPNSYWAILCTIRQVPRYRFLGSEFRLAERMTEAGMLERKDDRRYAVTSYGQRCYSANKVLAAR